MKLNFQQKATLKFKGKYNYEESIHIKNKDTILVNCNKHNIEFKVIAGYHLESKTGCCPGCVKDHTESIKLKYTSTTEQFIEKAKNIYGDKYDYSKFIYTLARKKSILVCKVHGDFEISPNNHLRGKQCPDCSLFHAGKNKSSTAEKQFKQKASTVHKDKYSYSNFIYTKAKIKSKITCKTHGDFLCSPDNHLRGRGCPVCGKINSKFITLNKFKTACNRHNKLGVLYVLKFKHIKTNHEFVKIGITSKSVEDRYPFEQYSEYTYENLKQYYFKPEKTYKCEQKIHSLYNRYRDHSVLKDFQGYSECYLLNLPLDEVFKSIEMFE